jgi:hypothetical protein
MMLKCQTLKTNLERHKNICPGCIVLSMCIISGPLYYWLSDNYWTIAFIGGLLGSTFGLIFWFSYVTSIHSGNYEEGCTGCIIVIAAVIGTSVASGALAYFFKGNGLAIAIVGSLIGLIIGAANKAYICNRKSLIRR